MTEALKFRISSELKNIIGRELITDDFIAIFELVKNSYDANASKVEIFFKNIKNNRDETSRIFIIDDGEGMSYNDIQNKWLFVGYSEKKELEKELRNKDFRNKIGKRRIFAGAKGIGRFSCDRLGSNLKLYTKKEDEDYFHVLHMDWDKFEKDPTTEFQTINVDYETRVNLNIGIELNGFIRGTVLEIFSLRENWDRSKILKLKRHLERLINPAQVNEELEFNIYIRAEEYLEDDDKYEEYYEKVNGNIRNILFERLGIKTTQITCHIDESREKVYTELIDKGTFIYRIEEQNEYKPLHSINIRLFFLNQSAKAIFTRNMGIEPVRYGSVFFYKNGIKINPCGNEGDDWLGLDRRKTQGTRRFLGNRDVIGRIEVSGYQPYFREVSSRDGGVIKTREFELLIKLFEEKALRRLEKYVVEGINWDSEKKPKDPEEIKADSFKIVSQLIGKAKDEAEKIEFNENLMEIYTKKQLEKTPELIKNIETLKRHVKTIEEKAYIDIQVKAVRNAFRTLQNKQKELERDLKLKEDQALFLKYIAGEDKTEIIVLQHQIGLGADTITQYLLNLKDKIERKEFITNDDLIYIIDNILLQTQIMSSITSFVTRANFDLMTQLIKRDLASYIKQYVERVYIPLKQDILKNQNVTIKIESEPDIEFNYVFNPFEFIVVIDNLIKNSVKAKARHIDIKIDVLDKNTMELKVKDDGVGIPDKNIGKIFDFGFSTTGGSGIGLYHVKKILQKYGSITVNNRLEKGVEFIIRVVR